MKSLLVNVFFPAWVWIDNPGKKFLYASNSEDLAVRDSVVCRKLIESPWYQSLFDVKLSRDQNQKSRFSNTKGGVRLAFGVGGAITGEGANFVIGDDVLKAQEANSDASREKVNLWWDTTMSTRLNNYKTDVRILIGQRLHENDIFGYLEDKGEHYEQIILPAEYEGVRYQSTVGLDDPRTVENELLWPGRFGAKELADLKVSLGELGVAGQLQQRPSIQQGNIFKKDWFTHRENSDTLFRLLSFDTAASTSKTAAYTACTVGEVTTDYKLFIREVWRDRVDFPDLQKQIERLAQKYRDKLHYILIENKSSGISVIQSIQKSSPDWIARMIVPISVKADKDTRANSAAIWASQGCISLSNDLEVFEQELFTFPNSKYKDQTDSFTQLVDYVSNYLEAGLRA
jgi:predicted phage terminase large subunit-like protein